MRTALTCKVIRLDGDAVALLEGKVCEEIGERPADAADAECDLWAIVPDGVVQKLNAASNKRLATSPPSSPLRANKAARLAEPAEVTPPAAAARATSTAAAPAAGVASEVRSYGQKELEADSHSILRNYLNISFPVTVDTLVGVSSKQSQFKVEIEPIGRANLQKYSKRTGRQQTALQRRQGQPVSASAPITVDAAATNQGRGNVSAAPAAGSSRPSVQELRTRAARGGQKRAENIAAKKKLQQRSSCS